MSLEMIRALLAFGGALLAALLVGRPYLFALRRLGLGQHIRAEGPQSHQQKAGTPTMGGIIILTALSVTLLALGAVHGRIALAFFFTIGFGLLGLIDDLLSITKGRNMGLKARQKLLGQVLLGVLLTFYAVRAGFNTSMPLPFFTSTVSLGLVLFYGLSLFAIVGTSNGVNLSDGLDGLAGGTVTAAAMTQVLLAFFFHQPEMAVFPAAIAGSCLGFLWFNAHPAIVFMGDTGSLALGGALAAASVLTKTTFFLPIIAGIFLIEDLSVMLQVGSFQVLHRRILRMAPLHHHFELGGWAEEKVVIRFWIAGAVFGLLSLLAAWPGLKG